KTPPTNTARYYTQKHSIAKPNPEQPPHPPLWIGAKGERMLRLTARHADVWNSNARGFAESVDASRTLDEACSKIGRDPATLRRSLNVTFDGADATIGKVDAAVKAGFSELLIMISNRGAGEPRTLAADAAKLLGRLRQLG